MAYKTLDLADVEYLRKAIPALQKVIPWKENLTVYSARRAARLTGPVGQCLIERGDETVKANFKTILERGDVLRFQR